MVFYHAEEKTKKKFSLRLQKLLKKKKIIGKQCVFKNYKLVERTGTSLIRSYTPTPREWQSFTVVIEEYKSEERNGRSRDNDIVYRVRFRTNKNQLYYRRIPSPHSCMYNTYISYIYIYTSARVIYNMRHVTARPFPCLFYREPPA